MSEENKSVVLQTLKDICDKTFGPVIGDDCDYGLIDVKILRRVAREWVDTILKNFKNSSNGKNYDLLLKVLSEKDTVFYRDKYYSCDDIDVYSTANKIVWIRYFFNLEDGEGEK